MIYLSIKPVDFQLSIPRTVEATKVRGDDQQKEMAQQQGQVGITKDQAEKSMKQVQKRNQAEEARIREKQEKQGLKDNKRESKDSDNKENDNSKKRIVETNKTSTFDVKI